MPDSMRNSGSPGMEAQIAVMTRLAEEAISSYRVLAASAQESTLQLQKISSKQDEIAIRMGEGREKMADHSRRLGDLEKLATVHSAALAGMAEHSKDIADLKTGKAELTASARMGKWILGTIAAGVLSVWGAIAAALNIYLRLRAP